MNSENIKTEEQPKRQIEFDFEKLKVYRASLGFLDDVFERCGQLPWEVKSSLGDQLRRAVLSISNNLAEGSGKRSEKEKARYYEVALDSTRECLSMFNVLLRQRLIDEGRYAALRANGREITRTGLINAPVIPAKAGIRGAFDPRFREDDICEMASSMIYGLLHAL